jgi:hypothetical protein|tara:strand:- start:314 stop:1201 length:888 start_codon:yes stop_codon:yes gene_type:complete
MPARTATVVRGPVDREYEIMPSNLETIDRAFYNWLDETLDIFATSNRGWNKVPLLWVSAERAFQVKHDKDLRDSNGVLKLPLVTIERTGIEKDPSRKGIYQAHIPPQNDAKGGAIVISKRMNQTKTGDFANADSFKTKPNFGVQGPLVGQLNFPFKNNKVVYETLTMPVPTYVNISYNVILRGSYFQQINEMLTPFLVKTGQINNFFINADGHKFEGFLPQDFAQNNNVANLGDDERTFETSISIRILGYLIGAGKNEERPKITVRENAVDIKLPREHVILGDIPTTVSGAFYRP